jgi:hypothetical protein
MAEDASLKLDTLQRDILAPQIQAFIDATSDAQARGVYGLLKDAVDAMEVPIPLADRLGAIIEVALSSGRIRRLFGPGSEQSLYSLFLKTPRGLQLQSSVDSLNHALGELRGNQVESVSAAIRRPGAYALIVKTDRCQLTIRFDPEGVRMETVEVDLK